MLSSVIIGLTALMLPSAASAWGVQGHQVVALVAYHYLDPAVRAKVDSMLASDTTQLTSHNLVAESIWADRYRDSDSDTTQLHYNATRRWHYIDLELDHPNIEKACYGHPPLHDGVLASRGPADDCIVGKINEFEAELEHKTTNAQERLLALKYLLHFVADLHQPLHASDDHDKGGNGENVFIPGSKPASLHAYWDTRFVQRLGKTARSVALALIVNISRAQVRQWSKGYPSDWARESFDRAKTMAYGFLRAPNRGHMYRLDRAYVRIATRVVAEQLSKAGVRLARLLNEAFGKYQRKPS